MYILLYFIALRRRRRRSGRFGKKTAKLRRGALSQFFSGKTQKNELFCIFSQKNKKMKYFVFFRKKTKKIKKFVFFQKKKPAKFYNVVKLRRVNESLNILKKY